MMVDILRLRYLLSGLIWLTFHIEAVHAQRFDAPLISVKTNLIPAYAGSLNAGVELVLRRQITFDDSMTSLFIPVSYNPFTYENNKKIRHLSFQPEFRFRIPAPGGSVFTGVHGLIASYNVGGIEVPFNLAPDLKEQRYQGQLFGAGLGAGYYLKLGRSFGIEASLGAGYVYMQHEVFRCESCGYKLGDETRNYLGLTRVALSIAYVIK